MPERIMINHHAGRLKEFISFTDLVENAKTKGFNCFKAAAEKQKDESVTFWKNRSEDDMIDLTEADHKDYLYFFDLLINLDETEKAIDFYCSLDTSPRGNIFQLMEDAMPVEAFAKA